MSVDLIRRTPAFVICSQAAASDPFKSMPLVASSITQTLSPNARASSAEFLHAMLRLDKTHLRHRPMMDI